MTTISAKVIADSRSDLGKGFRLTTFELMYPRCIHSELMTHRVFSRNASSSRAIPVAKQIQMVLDDPFIPLHWGKNQKGMQAEEECNTSVVMVDTASCDKFGYCTREVAWLEARDRAVEIARSFNDAGYHKQIVNRLLEPFAHIKVVVSATEYDNFFELRRHKDAEPHIQILANKMYDALNASTAVRLREGEWHLPYVVDKEKNFLKTEVVRDLSAARCARTSYLNFDGTVSPIEKDLELCHKLVGSKPLHASPFEHQATPSMDKDEWANFRGFRQYRYELENQWQNAL